MSDPTPETSAEKPAEPAAIDFERAEFAEAVGQDGGAPQPAGEQVQCAVCQQPITTEYWQYVGKVLCDTCREGVEQATGDARRGATMGRAFVLGGGVALACGVGYAVFVGLTHIHFALVTIGIGWAVGRTIQKVTRGFGSQKHQILAVALTYFATSMGYAPSVFSALTKGASAEVAGAATSAPPAAPAAASTAEPTAAPPPAPSAPAPQGGPGLAISLVILTAVTTAFMLAAPFLDLASGFSGILGALIMFFGLRTAWRVAQGIDAPITGPHKISSAS